MDQRKFVKPQKGNPNVAKTFPLETSPVKATDKVSSNTTSSDKTSSAAHPATEKSRIPPTKKTPPAPLNISRMVLVTHEDLKDVPIDIPLLIIDALDTPHIKSPPLDFDFPTPDLDDGAEIEGRCDLCMEDLAHELVSRLPGGSYVHRKCLEMADDAKTSKH